MAQSDKPHPQNRLDHYFSERYVSAIQGISDQLWRRYPGVSDPADRDNVIEHTLRRVADHEAKRGEAQNLPGLIRHVFQQVVANLLRKGRYKVHLASLEDSDAEYLSERAHSAESIEKQLWVADILRALDDRTRSVLTLRYLAGFETVRSSSTDGTIER